MRDELRKAEKDWHRRTLFRRRMQGGRWLAWLIAGGAIVTVVIVAA